jgi:hypothetical protein
VPKAIRQTATARSFSDWLVARGHRITHLLDLGTQREHPPRLL